MNSLDEKCSTANLTDPTLVGIWARTGTATAGAIVQRTRVAAVVINPIISPAAPIVVVVKKSYTKPARTRITLKVSGRVRQPVTLIRTMTALSGNIQLFETPTGGAEFTFTAVSTTESERVIPANEINVGKVLFAQSDSPCFDLDDYRLKLTLGSGPTSGPPLEVNVVAVSLTLDISAPRTAPGAILVPLPQPSDPPAVPPTDKWFGGVQLNSQDPGNNQSRVELRALVRPGAFAGDLVLRQVVVSGANVGALANKVQLFDDEIPGPNQLTPIVEVPKANPFEFNAGTAGFPGRPFFVEGRVGSAALRDTGFQLGVKNVENDGDRVALTVLVAPVITVDKPLVVVKKAHTNPARRVISLRASSAFSRAGTLKRVAGGPAIHVFDSGGTEILDLATGHALTTAQLSAGLQFFVESSVPSGAANDVQFTLSLAPGGPVPVGVPATVKMTAVELTLDVGLSRTAPGVVPPLMLATDKISPGRFVQERNSAFTNERAMIVLRPPNPSIPLTVRLESLTTTVQAFGIEAPAAGQSAQPSPATFPSDLLTVPSTGFTLFGEGTGASTAVRDTGFRYGIDGLENECDRVVMTVLGDPSQTGPYRVGQHEYTEAQEGTFNLPLPGGGGGTFAVRRKALVRYPADASGVDVPVSSLDSTYPLILILHGNHRPRLSPGGPFVESFRGLEYIASHLASYGFIALSIDADDINGRPNAIVQRGDAILEHLQVMIRRNTSGPLFTGKIDLSHIGLVGHSRGGEGVLAAQQLNVSRVLGHNIRGIVSIAPTNAQNFVHNTTPYLIVYGSSDGDVHGADDSVNPFLIFDRAAPPKAMLFVYAAMHNRFSTNADWLDSNHIDNDDPRIISEADHQNIAKGYTAAFFERNFRQILEFDALFKRYGRPPSVAAVEIHHQVSEPGSLLVDNFDQAGHNASVNALALAVTQTGLGNPTGQSAPLVEVSFLAADTPSFVHATFGEMIAWDNTSGVYRTTLGGRDVSAFRVLSFRVTQRLGSPRNPVNTAQDFFVRLTDTASQSAAVQVSSVTTIPFPFQRHDHSLHAGPPGSPRAVDQNPDSPSISKSALKTIRVSLAAFTADNSRLNLRALQTLSFEFRQTSKGEIGIDDIEFSN